MKQCVLPSLRGLLQASPLEDLAHCLRCWARLLQAPSGAACPSAWQNATLGSNAACREAAIVLLGLVAHEDVRLLPQVGPSDTAQLLTDALCHRMLETPLPQPHFQCLALEVFALVFSLWRAGGHGASGGRQDDLEWLAVQCLNLYQEPRVARSCLSVVMQLGSEDPMTLLRVMGRAARTHSSTYASSALWVLVTFINRFPDKLISLLPKFTEVVLRCLEPNDPPLRRQSLQTVTTALHQLVQTFPMVAFHQESQKFAVGTADKLVVVYDLRTATKWRILEGHTGEIAAVAFSKNGLKLASYSADNSLRVWQCDSTGFFSALLGNGSRCSWCHALPSQEHVPSDCAAWRSVSLTWTETGHLRLVRESGGNPLVLRPH